MRRSAAWRKRGLRKAPRKSLLFCKKEAKNSYLFQPVKRAVGWVALWQPIINDKKFQGIILIFAKTGACAGNVEN
jgi:hypothetical protein